MLDNHSKANKYFVNKHTRVGGDSSSSWPEKIDLQSKEMQHNKQFISHTCV